MPEPATKSTASPERLLNHFPAVPFALSGDGGERLDIGPATIIVRASADNTGGAFTVFEEHPPLLDTSRHVHHNEDEMYYVLEGDQEFVCEDLVFRLGPGGVVFLPRGIPHEHRRLVPGAGRLLSMTSPAGFEGFFRILAEAAGAGELGESAYARASELYGIEWVS